MRYETRMRNRSSETLRTAVAILSLQVGVYLHLLSAHSSFSLFCELSITTLLTYLLTCYRLVYCTVHLVKLFYPLSAANIAQLKPCVRPGLLCMLYGCCS